MDGVMKLDEYYRNQLKNGTEFQDFVFDVLYDHGLPLISYSSKKYQIEKGENKAGIEIKYDKKFAKSGCFWIEIAEKKCKNNPHWIASGIYRTDNSWLYLIGNYEVFYIFPTFFLIIFTPRFYFLKFINIFIFNCKCI